MAESLVSVLGRQPMTPTDLLKEINQADWPYVVHLAPSDFFALNLQMGIVPDTGDDGHSRFFWVGPTKVTSVAKGDLDLRNWQPSLVEIVPPSDPMLSKGGLRLVQ